MKILFWLAWSADVLMLAFVVVAKSFRRSFTASDPTAWFDVLLIGCTVAALLCQVWWHKPVWALVLAVLPWLALLLWSAVS